MYNNANSYAASNATAKNKRMRPSVSHSAHSIQSFHDVVGVVNDKKKIERPGLGAGGSNDDEGYDYDQDLYRN